MTAFDPNQDYAAKLDRRFDWSLRLPSLVGSPTLSTATVTCATAGVVIDNATHDATSVTFRLSQSGISSPTWVDIVCHVVLSDGQEDEDTMQIRFKDI